MRRFVLCVGLLAAACGLPACGGGGDSSDSSGGRLTSSSISLPSSVQVVSAH